MRLTPEAAQGIGMALHELSTNAGKYGALSNDDGRVHISWRFGTANEPVFLLSWLEEGGPPAAPATRKGFGQTVIGRMVEAAVDGAAKIDYREGRFSWRLRAPLAGTLQKGRLASSAGGVRG